MFRYCEIKKCSIGAGRPKICVPLTGTTPEEVLSQAKKVAQAQESSAIDMVELRGDYLCVLHDFKQLDKLLKDVAEILSETVLLFTIRSEQEGGEHLDFSTPDIYEINRYVIENHLADIVDIELFSGEERIKMLVKLAHEKHVKIIMSNHDFQTTPNEDVIVKRLCTMQNLGADIIKIAVMPENKQQVLQLLSATVSMQEKYAQVPVVTMSMGKMGVVSRMIGQFSGSAITFASLARASAPGQIPVEDMNTVLSYMEKYS